MAEEKKTPIAEVGKTYQLTKDEQARLAGWDFMIKQSGYLGEMFAEFMQNVFTSGITQDKAGFTKTVIKKRLNIPDNQLVEISVEKGTITLVADKEAPKTKIFKPGE